MGQKLYKTRLISIEAQPKKIVVVVVVVIGVVVVVVVHVVVVIPVVDSRNIPLKCAQSVTGHGWDSDLHTYMFLEF